MSNDYQKQRQLEERAMPMWQLRAVRNGVIRTCINCEHWEGNVVNAEKRKEECRLAPGQRPPALVLVLGCDAWQQEIPF